MGRVFSRKSDKRGVSEITSFVLLTLIVVTSSIFAYTYSKGSIDRKFIRMDIDNAKSYFKKIHYDLLEIKNFEGATFGMDISFHKGVWIFEGSNLYYQSENKYVGSDYCFTEVCYTSRSGFEMAYINLSSGYVFAQNFTLTPGNYMLIFKNVKNESKVEVYVK